LDNHQIHPELHDLKGKSIWSPNIDFQKGLIPRTKKNSLAMKILHCLHPFGVITLNSYSNFITALTFVLERVE